MDQNKEKNFVSAVVYLYNDDKYILQFIENVEEALHDNFLKYEIIVVNDKSTDNSADIIKEYSTNHENSSITLLNMSFHQGLETSMNAGMDLSIGDFVFEFDSVYVDYDWKVMMDIYFHSLKGYDIVNAKSEKRQRFTSDLFYSVMNRYARLQYSLTSETFRILSRRAINRIHSISAKIPYRKAIYANCGLKYATLSYKPKKEIKSKRQTNRFDIAINSLILFTDVAYRATITMAICMIVITVATAIYALSYYIFNNPVKGWTTTILFLSFAFCGLFTILAMIIKYLSILIKLNFVKKDYIFESIEKL